MISAEYDAEADALYVRLGSLRRGVDETIEIDESRLVDLDEEGRPIGIEILGLVNYRIDDIAERFGLGDRLADIDASVARAIVAERRRTSLAGGQAG